MGQHYLALLSKSAGLVANSSTDDKAGWDFELETASPTTVNYHSHSKPLYRIQVKSTLGSSQSVSMSFSSLLSLIQFPGPSFLFFVRFDQSGETVPAEARLLHIDQSLARTILTRMRKQEIKRGSDFKINKASTSISFVSATSVDLRDGSRFRALLSAVTDASHLDYVRDKTDWLRELENESRAMRLSVHFENDAAVQAMADALLGYDTQMSVDTVPYYAPMGIPGELPKHSGVFLPAQISPLEENIRRATVRLRAREFGATYSFPAKLYSTGGMVPPKFEGMRIHASMFDILLKRKPFNVQLALVSLDDPDLLVPVRDLRNFVAFIDDASHVDVTHTYLEVELDDKTPPLRLNPSTQAAVFEGHYEMRLAFDALYAKLDGIGLGNANIRPADYWTLPGNLTFVQHVGTAYSTPFSFEFDAPESSNGDANVVVFQTPLALESATVHFFGAFFGSVELRGFDKAFGTFTHSTYLGEFIAREGTDPTIAKKAFEHKVEKSLEAQGFRVF